jgi:ribosomal protein S7
MRRGKASLAEYMFLKALSKIKKITLKNPFYILKKAIYNTSPVLFYIEFKKGKRIFRLPSKISQSKALFYGIK